MPAGVEGRPKRPNAKNQEVLQSIAENLVHKKPRGRQGGWPKGVVVSGSLLPPSGVAKGSGLSLNLGCRRNNNSTCRPATPPAVQEKKPRRKKGSSYRRRQVDNLGVHAGPAHAAAKQQRQQAAAAERSAGLMSEFLGLLDRLEAIPAAQREGVRAQVQQKLVMCGPRPAPGLPARLQPPRQPPPPAQRRPPEACKCCVLLRVGCAGGMQRRCRFVRCGLSAYHSLMHCRCFLNAFLQAIRYWQ